MNQKEVVLKYVNLKFGIQWNMMPSCAGSFEIQRDEGHPPTAARAYLRNIINNTSA